MHLLLLMILAMYMLEQWLIQVVFSMLLNPMVQGFYGLMLWEQIYILLLRLEEPERDAPDPRDVRDALGRHLQELRLPRRDRDGREL